jgi:hypothetical protein
LITNKGLVWWGRKTQRSPKPDFAKTHTNAAARRIYLHYSIIRKQEEESKPQKKSGRVDSLTQAISDEYGLMA